VALDLSPAETQLLSREPVVGLLGTKQWLTHFEHNLRWLQQKGFYPTEFERPLACQLELTQRCNLRCVYCYNRSGERSNKELAPRDWVQIAKQLVDAGVFQCVISGGEPLLLGKALFAIMDILHQAGVKFILITNGTFLDHRCVRSLRKYDYYFLQVSIDAPNQTVHDKIRGRGSWQGAVRAASLTSQNNIPLVVASTLTRHNVGYLPDMIDFAYYLGAKRIIVGQFSPVGRACLNYEAIRLSKRDRISVDRTLRRKMLFYRNRMEVVRSMDAHVSLRHNSIQPSSVLIIRPNGDVRVDCVGPFKIGNVTEESVMQIWNRIGRKVWRVPEVSRYVYRINNHEDFLKVTPRPYVDSDIDLSEKE